MQDGLRTMFADALRLAHFIHADRRVALRVTVESLAGLEVAASAQEKRLSYRPSGRAREGRAASASTHRSKVLMSGPQLLQRLIYITSEPYEREAEAGGSRVSHEDLTVRYVKHLVRITVKRNSFYVSLGITRLLHNYSTADAMSVNDLLTQDPERLRDDYYFRSRKKVLLAEMRERFRDFLRVAQGRRGEERFESRAGGEAPRELVAECLRLFTPWETHCVLPERFDPSSARLQPLAFDGENPDGEHPIEVNRMHSVIHPECFQRLTRSLGLDAPDRRLEVPRFFNADEAGGGDGGGRRGQFRPPSDEELLAAEAALGAGASRRKAASAGWLSVSVDGSERARFDLTRGGSAAVEVEDGDELVQVHALKGQERTLLANFLLEDAGDLESPMHASVVLEGGQRVTFALHPAPDTRGDERSAKLSVTYEETAMARAAVLAARRWMRGLMEIPGAFRAQLALKAGLATALVLVAFMAGFMFMRFRSVDPSRTVATSTTPQSLTENSNVGGLQPKVSPQPSPTATPEAEQALPQEQAPPKRPSRSRGRRVPTGAPPVTLAPTLAQNTRGGSATPPRHDAPPRDTTYRPPASDEGAADLLRSVPEGQAVSLLQVKRVAVEVTGDDVLGKALRESLAGALRAGGMFEFVGDAAKADGLLEVTLEVPLPGEPANSPATMQVAARLLRADGQTLWLEKLQFPAGTRPADAATRLVRDLRATVERLKREREPRR